MPDSLSFSLPGLIKMSLGTMHFYITGRRLEEQLREFAANDYGIVRAA